MKITEIVKKGTLDYTHYYNQTMTSVESADHELECPEQLLTIAAEHPSAVVVIYGDETLGIDVDGKTWAVQCYDAAMRPGVQLPKDVWLYINIAMGME